MYVNGKDREEVLGKMREDILVRSKSQGVN